MVNKEVVLSLVEAFERNDSITIPHSEEEVKIACLALEYKRFMELLEIPVDENSKDTPFRVAKMMYYERTKALRDEEPELTVFPNENYDEYITIKDIPFTSLCSHHHVIFNGKAHIIYHPKNSILGLSKFARVVDYFSCKPNIQENLTSEILDYLWDKLQPFGILVKIEAVHHCVTTRGVKAVGSSTITQRIKGDIDRVEASHLLS